MDRAKEIVGNREDPSVCIQTDNKPISCHTQRKGGGGGGPVSLTGVLDEAGKLFFYYTFILEYTSFEDLR